MNEELSRRMALIFVCPKTMSPATPYEHDMVEAMTAFGCRVLEEAQIQLVAMWAGIESATRFAVLDSERGWLNTSCSVSGAQK